MSENTYVSVDETEYLLHVTVEDDRVSAYFVISKLINALIQGSIAYGYRSFVMRGDESSLFLSRLAGLVEEPAVVDNAIFEHGVNFTEINVIAFLSDPTGLLEYIVGDEEFTCMGEVYWELIDEAIDVIESEHGIVKDIRKYPRPGEILEELMPYARESVLPRIVSCTDYECVSNMIKQLHIDRNPDVRRVVLSVVVNELFENSVIG